MPQTNRKLDVICLGRLGVDIYAQQIGARLEDVSSFAKYLGGSSANIAFGTARLGLKSSMLTRVGDEHMGRFLRESLQREGCDVSHVKTDPARLTALVILGIKDRDTFPLIFYRENCADMAISEEDFDEAYIASARALVITGTHFSTPSVHKTSMKALEYARKNGVKTVLDIDYRPVLWGLTGRGEGEQRFIQSDAVTAHLQNILPHFDLLVGTEEEINIAGGSQDLMTSLRAIRKVSKAVLVVKLGVKGCAVIEGEIPKTIDDAINIGGFPVEVLNVLGAGDAFMSGFLKGYLTGADWKECGRLGNACGAIVVSRHACSPAMPTPVELEYFFKNYHRLQRPDQDATLARLHRVTVPRQKWDDLVVFAFDHRTQFFDLAQQVGASEKRLFELKELLVKAVEETEKELKLSGRIGILADDRYGQDALNAATGRRWWIGRPVEMPGSNPLEFDHGRAIGSNFISWPQEHIIKCLVQYHPDETVENRIEQETQVLALYQAAQVSGNELLLEVIPSKKLPQKSDTVLRAMKRFYNLGIYPEWWKLESMSAEQWREVDALINERDPYCRGVVILGLNAPLEQLAASFRDAQGSTTVRGFAVGRTIFQEPSKQWLAGKIDSKELVSQVRKNFEALIRAWQSNRKSRTEAA